MKTIDIHISTKKKKFIIEKSNFVKIDRNKKKAHMQVKSRKLHSKNMLVGTQSHCSAANLSSSKGGTDFSIAAIMARGAASREPSEKSMSK